MVVCVQFMPLTFMYLSMLTSPFSVVLKLISQYFHHVYISGWFRKIIFWSKRFRWVLALISHNWNFKYSGKHNVVSCTYRRVNGVLIKETKNDPLKKYRYSVGLESQGLQIFRIWRSYSRKSLPSRTEKRIYKLRTKAGFKQIPRSFSINVESWDVIPVIHLAS